MRLTNKTYTPARKKSDAKLHRRVLLPLENSFSDRLMCKFSILYWVK
jgi:hypothetical protein